jgi:hypothetical protein
MSQQTQSAMPQNSTKSIVYIHISVKTVIFILEKKNDSQFSLPEHVILEGQTMQDVFNILAQGCGVPDKTRYEIQLICVRSLQTSATDRLLVHRLTSDELSKDKSFLDFLIEKYNELP